MPPVGAAVIDCVVVVRCGVVMVGCEPESPQLAKPVHERIRSPISVLWEERHMSVASQPR